MAMRSRAITQGPSGHQRHSNNQVANRNASPIDMMMARHNQMANEMIRMGSMMDNLRNPFGNDPFFQDSGNMFGNMDKMIGKMRSDMERQMAEPMESKMGGMGKGQFSQMQIVRSSKRDQAGNPITETYQTKAQGAFGNGNRVTERHQVYENTGNGHQKMAHERMMNDQGRKVVRQRVGGAGGPTQSNDVWRNVRPDNANQFDQEWDQMASHLGFSASNNRLAYAGNDQRSSGQQQQQQHRQAYTIDDGRLSHFDAPVPMRDQRAQQQQRGRRGIEPTVPGGSIHAPGNNNRQQQQAAQQRQGPMALPSSHDAPQAAPRRAAAPTQQRAAVHRMPRQAANKPAKAG